MKFRVTLKDPDALHDAVADAVRGLAFPGLTDAEAHVVREGRRAEVRESCRRWFEWGEYLTVEVDTDAGTCIVIPAPALARPSPVPSDSASP